MNESRDSKSTGRSREVPKEALSSVPWRGFIHRIATILIIFVLALSFGRRLLESFDGAKRTADKGLALADKTVDKTAEVLEKFHTGQITHTFRESFPQVGGNKGDVLEVATNRVAETFKKTDEKRLFWDRLYLGTTTAEIQLEAVFRYHVLLSDEWRLAARSNVCIVAAPAIRPTVPTAILTETMQKYAGNGWARFDKAEQLEELEKAITPALDQRAGDAAHLTRVRDACRRSIAEFVRTWLLKEEQWRSGRFTAIVVIFADEDKIESDDQLERVR